jgi:hypothetical protein
MTTCFLQDQDIRVEEDFEFEWILIKSQVPHINSRLWDLDAYSIMQKKKKKKSN